MVPPSAARGKGLVRKPAPSTDGELLLCEAPARDGGEQSLACNSAQLLTDEDGDVAHAFLELESAHPLPADFGNRDGL